MGTANCPGRLRHHLEACGFLIAASAKSNAGRRKSMRGWLGERDPGATPMHFWLGHAATCPPPSPALSSNPSQLEPRPWPGRLGPHTSSSCPRTPALVVVLTSPLVLSYPSELERDLYPGDRLHALVDPLLPESHPNGRYPSQLEPHLYLGDWGHAEAEARLDELRVKASCAWYCSWCADQARPGSRQAGGCGCSGGDAARQCPPRGRQPACRLYWRRQ